MDRAPAASLALLVTLLFTASAPALAAPTCSSDTFTIDGSVVAVQLCVSTPARPATHRGAATPPAATLDETFTVKGQTPLLRSVPLDAAPTDEPSRTIDDAPLQGLGLARTLHLTVAIKTSSVRLEHALLVPGAVALK